MNRGGGGSLPSPSKPKEVGGNDRTFNRVDVVVHAKTQG